MSWLYTILFSGFLLSSQTAQPVKSVNVADSSPVATAAASRLDEMEKFDKTYPFNPNGRLSMSNVNGSIVVEAWDRKEIRVEYTKVASTREHLADVEVRIDARADRMNIETDYDNWNTRDGRNWRTGKLNVEFHLMVPRTAVLNEVETVNGSVTVSNFSNFTKISAVNGHVKANNLTGAANLSTVNGEVSADFDRLESGSKIVLSTVNGKVNLLIPSDSNATLTADSVNGTIVNDFGLPVRKGKYVGRDLYGRLGSGDVRIKLDSVNGGLTIGHKNDGKSVSPAVDLLPQKEKDDENWDSDSDKDDDDDGKMVSKSMKMDRDAQRAVRDSQREAAKAVKAANREVMRIRPEIAQVALDSVASAVQAVTSAAVVVNTADVQASIDKAMASQREAMTRIAADQFFSNSLPVAKVKRQTYAVKGSPSVTVDAVGCSVRVRGWDRSEVQYRVTQFSDRRNAAPIDVTDTHTDSTVNIRVQNASYRERDGDFDDPTRRAVIEIFVPRRSDLTVKTNGEIRVDGVSGKLDLQGTDESINVRDAEGSLRAVNSDGRIRVVGFNGDVSAQTSDGEIELEGAFSKLSAAANEGSIFLTLPDDASADLEANCPDILGDSIAMTRVRQGDQSSLYRIGAGGAKYQIRTGGEIKVRGLNSIRASN